MKKGGLILGYSEVWDLDVFFSGGSESSEFRDHMNNLQEKVVAFAEEERKFIQPTVHNIVNMIEPATSVMMYLRQAGAFIGCLQAQNMNDRKADALRGELTSLSATFQVSFNSFQQKLSQTDDDVWNDFIQDEALRDLAFVLKEWREKAKEKLSNEEEALIQSLAVDGYHGWGEMYDTVVGSMAIEVEVDGELKTLSVGQANNLASHKNPAVRQEVFKKLEAAWQEKEEMFARTLNHLGGFRLQVYDARGWEEVLKEPLSYNRMKKETLDAMWGAISEKREAFVGYLNRKAELLGKEKLSWSDLSAPIATTTNNMSFDEGAHFIEKHFRKFGNEMADFTKQAFEQEWIEAEDRPGKRPGGFCTLFPLSEQSRIFMTYSGTMSNVATLAHELGHAFHSYALRPMHTLNRNYAMNVAETASTFAEMIVADAAVKEANTNEEKVALVEDKLQRSVAFFMNIHARFLFETRFYEERKQGMVSAERLNELMEAAQKEAYGDSLSDYHPHFWASKLHFYITGVPFYNFPYTFGYLFSLSIYAKAIEEGEGYEQKYINLLRDTAVMTVEELAMKHLGEDITQKDFWEKGMNLCVQDAEEFLRLTK
ncbi:M3 family oligoendopeptidase [Bacillus spongiae]|uniref:M3 family oligoendopeptidase n=1 Tax=Bacillus spongiae TaxID=2683610 RepID=A0ABU8HHV8_9BACI